VGSTFELVVDVDLVEGRLNVSVNTRLSSMRTKSRRRNNIAAAAIERLGNLAALLHCPLSCSSHSHGLNEAGAWECDGAKSKAGKRLWTLVVFIELDMSTRGLELRLLLVLYLFAATL
jgi:hypothetical protein